ncbi:class I SAM-dependent methyltransferase [Aggregicoccus sp. 17bor-14]|uniref:class I SAM-dependent methyltransferase n=1 Tax=Myxococcaceae TaxID=31 RepID=UPI00351A1FAF
MTTSGQPPEALVQRARARAREWGLPFVPRPRKAPLGPLLESVAEAFLVFEREAVTLTDRHGSFAFHAGMAHLRRMRLETGEGDTLVRLADLRPGDTVLDCTLGLGQDALVCARAVGPAGRVVGLEASLALYAVVSEGLAAYDVGPASTRVAAHHADARAWLARQESGSFDVVLFDPMFEKPKKSQPAFEVLRRFAEHAPLAPETLAEARRVARRWVLVKTGKHGEELRRLGLSAEPGSRYTSLLWARAPAL